MYELNENNTHYCCGRTFFDIFDGEMDLFSSSPSRTATCLTTVSSDHLVTKAVLDVLLAFSLECPTTFQLDVSASVANWL
jgi:hypothetical protein